jgi:prepilin peptidase CpaA
MNADKRGSIGQGRAEARPRPEGRPTESLIGRWVLGAVVVAAAATDLRMRQIPNWLTLPAMAAGLGINSFLGLGFAKALWGMLVALGTFAIFFAIGFMGAGDGKLMGAVGAFVGWPQIATVMVLVAVLGGLAGVVVAWRQGALGQVLRNTAGLIGDMVMLRWRAVKQQSDFRAPGRLRLPYGAVIALGTLVFLLTSPR